MECANGHEVAEGQRFCPKCGTQLEGSGPEWTTDPSDSPRSASDRPPASGSLPPPPQLVVAQIVPARPTNGLAIASMVLGILWIYWVGSILAVIFGAIAIRQARDRNESGSGMAIAGLVLGLVGLGTLALILILILVAHN
jgi:hypothetical protein